MNRIRPFALFLSLGFLLGGCLPDAPEGPDFWEVLSQDSRFTQLTQALERTGYDEDIKSGFFITLLAPTDEAFDKWLSANNFASINDVPDLSLRFLLRYHMQFSTIEFGTFQTGYFSTPCPASPDSQAVTLMVRKEPTGVFFNDSSKVIHTNISARTGYIHGINAVIDIPTIYDLLRYNSSFTILIEALNRSGLQGLLRGSSPHTLLACTNTAFEAYFTLKGFEDLEAMSDDEVKSLIRTHLLVDNITYQDFSDNVSKEYENLDGKDLRITSLSGGQLSINDTVGAVLLNVQGRNGIAHVITRLIDPE